MFGQSDGWVGSQHGCSLLDQELGRGEWKLKMGGGAPLPDPCRGMRGIGARDRLVEEYFPSEGAVGLENERFWVVDEMKAATKVAGMVG